ncbi:RNA-guided endonuclease InsQ/TnpB family protein [Nostoc sp.]|uniref:RNA-guided endonuclease InsQ/TnpB family protein n=1 Tax=Nostoc sp. TaxID=1180 RepID=UPI002FFAD598
MYSLKLELKLNNKERTRLSGCVGFARFVYNYGLSMLTQSWDFEGIKATDSKRLSAIEKIFTNYVLTNPAYSWMQQYASAIYSSAFRNLGKAFERWRKGQSEFPRYKSKKRGDSFTVLKKAGIYPVKGEPFLPFTNRQVLHPGNKINIPGLGEFRLKRPVRFICSSQTFTVSRTADKWFVAFTLDAEKIPPIFHPIDKLGVDLGVKTLATCSDGSKYDMPVTTKKAKIKLGKLQFHNRNKILGNKKLKIRASNNAKKYYTKKACQHAHITNIRQDTTQKMTTDISRKAAVIRIEDLNVQGMISNHKLASAVSNNCFYEIRRQFTYKQSHYGTKVELVDRWYPSSKMCCKCGHIQPMGLSERVYSCGNCGQIQDRDENASVNLMNAPINEVRLA